MLSFEVKDALRGLVRSRRLTTLAVMLTLATVVGVVACIFSLVQAVLLRPLPFGDPNRLITLSLIDRDAGIRNLPYPLYQDFATGLATATPLAALEFEDYGLLNGNWDSLRAAVVTTNLFDVLGVPPAPGRGFLPDDEVSAARPAVLSESAWRRYFGATPLIVGREIRLSHRLSEASGTYTVVGVARTTVASPGGRDVDVFIAESRATPSRRWWLSPTRYVIGRLAAGAVAQDVQAEATQRLRRWAGELSAYNITAVSVEGLQERVTKNWRPQLFTLLVAALLVLALACTNIGTLLLGTGRSRLREFGTRMALGATRAQIARQLLLENLALGTVGGIGALWLSALCLPALLTLVPGDVPRAAGAHVDWGVFAFALGVSAVCGLLFGVSPAVALSRGALHSSVRGDGQAVGRSALWTEGLLSLQLALALGLTTATTLAVVSEWRLAHAPTGFETANVLVADLSVGRRVETIEDYGRFQEALVTAVRTVPGVTDVALTDAAPPTPNGTQMLVVNGKGIFGVVRAVSGDYFKTMGLPLQFGRTLLSGERPRGLAVVNATLAREWFGRSDILGERIGYGDETLQVIGIVADARERTLREPARPTVYRFCGPGWSGPRSVVQSLVIKTRLGDGRTPGLVKEVLQRLNPDMPIAIDWLERRLSSERAQIRFYGRLLLLFSAFTLLVAALGVSANVRQTVSRRRREIAIRIALGANVSNVRLLVVRRLAIAGGLGIVVGWWLARVLGSLLASALYGLGPQDPAVLGAATLFLVGVAAAAAIGPMLTVTAKDLTGLLRCE